MVYVCAGMLHDSTGSHTFAFCVAGALMAVAGIMTIPMRRVKNIRLSYGCKFAVVEEESDSAQNLETGATQCLTSDKPICQVPRNPHYNNAKERVT